MLIAQNPAVTQDPTLRGLLDEVLELTGMSPSVIQTSSRVVQPTPGQAAQGTGVGTNNAGSVPIAQ